MIVSKTPLYFDDGRLKVDLSMNGTRVKAILDTASTINEVHPSNVAAFNLRHIDSTTTVNNIYGSGGGKFPNAVGHAVIGRVNMGTIPFVIRDRGQDPKEVLVGMRNMPGGIIDLNLAEQSLGFGAEPSDDFTPPGEGFQRLPVRMTGTLGLKVPVTINGQHFDALLDTGSAGTAVGLDAVERLGVPRDFRTELSQDVELNWYYRQNGIKQKRFETFDVFGKKYENWIFPICELAVPVLLGLDFVSNVQIVIVATSKIASMFWRLPKAYPPSSKTVFNPLGIKVTYR